MSIMKRTNRRVSGSSGKARKGLVSEDLAFIAAGRTDQGKLSPVSERHDEALAVALLEDLGGSRRDKAERSSRWPASSLSRGE